MSRDRPLILVDANVFISYLLPSSRTIRTVTRFVELVVLGDFRQVLPNEVVDELITTIATKRKLNTRIPLSLVEGLVADLRQVSIPARYVPPPYPRIVRDAKDDYLLAYALSEDVDYLVTYDVDLLSLSLPEGSPRIVSPPMLLEILDRIREGPPDR